MHFLNEQLAKEFLNRINYFRLKYFWIDMLDMESGDFKKDIYFEDVIDRYELDKSFRQIIFDAIETLEIGLRTKIISTLHYRLAQDYGTLIIACLKISIIIRNLF